MHTIEKILKKFDDRFDHYETVVKISDTPNIFRVQLEDQVFTGFVTEFKPTRGKVSFILTEGLSDENSFKYIYDKGHKDVVKVDLSEHLKKS